MVVVCVVMGLVRCGRVGPWLRLECVVPVSGMVNSDDSCVAVDGLLGLYWRGLIVVKWFWYSGIVDLLIAHLYIEDDVCLKIAVLAFFVSVPCVPQRPLVSVAIYHFSKKVFSRANGHSSCAAAAYRSGEKIYDERTGETHDYSNRTGVIASEIIAPHGSPDWTQDRARLWNHGEASEIRKDAQVARENILAVHHELTTEQNMELVRDFAADCYVSKGMIADISYHEPDKHGDNRNHHAHILLTLRPINEHGEFGNKERAWNSKELLFEERAMWAEYSNLALERAGSSERIDERSFEDQGKDRIPTNHMGKDATQMERNGEQTRIGDENREAEYWNRELDEIERDKKIIVLAIEREKRKMAQEQQRKAAVALTEQGETLRQKAQGFQDEHALLAEKQNAQFLKQLDQRRTLEADIAQRRVELNRTNQEFYNITQAQEAHQKAIDDLKTKETVLGRLTGQEQRAQDHVEELRLNLEDIERRQAESTGAFDKQAEDQLHALDHPEQEQVPVIDPPALSEDREDFREYTPDDDPYAQMDNDTTLSQDFEQAQDSAPEPTQDHTPEPTPAPAPSANDTTPQTPTPEQDRGPSMDY